jgi:hypothetical protein
MLSVLDASQNLTAPKFPGRKICSVGKPAGKLNFSKELSLTVFFC